MKSLNTVSVGQSPDFDDEEEESASEVDSDEELQEAFAAGVLKPGLHRLYESKSKDKKSTVNDVASLKQKLSELRDSKMPWIERLDLINVLAPLAPELALKESEHAKKRELAAKKSLANDEVHNDFKRELLFYRQGQAAVLEALPRLHSMGVATKRPSDYFAQMAKSDDHMQKVRQKLAEKQVSEERVEKIRKLREQKKFGKKVQIEVQQKRQKEKREMLEQVKKFRKGKIPSVDFLDDAAEKKKKKGAAATSRPNAPQSIRTQKKNEKFGMGGKKRGLKRNTKASLDSLSDTKGKKKAGPGKRFGGAAGKNQKKTQRPGKSRRKQMKNRKSK